MTNLLHMLFWMLVAHSLIDYAWQGDFMAKAKNQKQPITGVPWVWPMLSHAIIHAGAVVAITRSYALGLLEFGFHFLIDRTKCDGDLNYTADQILHIVCKVAWLAIWAVVNL